MKKVNGKLVILLVIVLGIFLYLILYKSPYIGKEGVLTGYIEPFKNYNGPESADYSIGRCGEKYETSGAKWFHGGYPFVVEGPKIAPSNTIFFTSVILPENVSCLQLQNWIEQNTTLRIHGFYSSMCDNAPIGSSCDATMWFGKIISIE